MGLFSKWKEKRKNKKQQTQEIKHPESSYDIYNQSETLTLQTDVNKDILVAYESDEVSLSNEKGMKTSDKNETPTKTTSIKTKGANMTEKKGRNIYYVSARKDKDGKKIGWEVKKENADKITKLCKTKEEAIEYVKEKAGNQGSTCIIRKVDGSIDKTLKFEAK